MPLNEVEIRRIIAKKSWTPAEANFINDQYDTWAKDNNHKPTDRSCPSCTLANIRFFRSYYAT